MRFKEMRNVIGIIGAMENEVYLLTKELSGVVQQNIGGIDFYYGRIASVPVTIARSGIGKVNAAMCTQILIDRFDIKSLINTGVAGGIGQNLSIGDFVIGETLAHHDFDISLLGYAKGNIGTEERDSVTVFHSNPSMIEQFKEAALGKLPLEKLQIGLIVTGDAFIASSKRKQALREDFKATAVEMEAAAIAQVAEANQIPCIVVRAISDLADDGAEVTFDEFAGEASRQSAEIVIEMLRIESRKRKEAAKEAQ